MRDLWSGRLRLGRAFWECAILYGTCANVGATIGALAALALDLPGWLAVAVFLLPVPYLVVAVVGVSRSADRYHGPSAWAKWAKVAVLVWAALMIVL